MNRQIKPPKWPERLFSFLIHTDQREEILGDLQEAYHWRLEQFGLRKANRLYLWEMLRSIGLSHLKPISQLTGFMMMYRNYLTTGWRFLKKHKLYSTLNILGLAMGLACCWLAYLYANDESSYDKHFPEYHQLYRTVIDLTHADNVHHIGGSSTAMVDQIKEKIPEVEAISHIKSGYGVIRKGEEYLNQYYLRVDREIIDMLGLEFLEGARGAFDSPNDLIISETLASKLNLRGNAVGKILTINSILGPEDFVINGVYKDLPSNSSIQTDAMISFEHYRKIAKPNRLVQWFDINMNALVKIRPDADVATVTEKLNQLHLENDEEIGDRAQIKLQPIAEIHLDTTYGHYNGIASGGNQSLITIFLAVGIFCLVISVINYANFTISLYINRAREVALRKVLGAQKSGIFSQLISESFLSTALAAILGVTLLIGILPYFSEFVNKGYSISSLLHPVFAIGALGILIVCALVSGSYPALVLSRFPIVKSLKGEQKIRSGKWITQGLLAIQFVIATILITGMLTMNNQLQYLSAFDTKVNPENVLYYDYLPGDEEKIVRFLQELNQESMVQSTAGISGYNGTIITLEDGVEVETRHLRIHNDLLSMLEIDLIAGRNFDPSLPADQLDKIIVNEAFVKAMDLQNPVGQRVPFKYGDLENPQIIGVIEDYHFESVKQKIEPLVVYQCDIYPIGAAYVKLGSMEAFDQNRLDEIARSHFDPFPTEYVFLQDYYEKAFKSEKLLMRLVGIGCLISILLAATGLLGLIALNLTQRLKEISIRKVLGATESSLYLLYGKRFLLIIFGGLIVGLLISRQLIITWLENFPYHTSFSIGIVLSTILIGTLVATITIFSQISRVSRANPIEYLRDE
ncbi:FtsX-like permease family protein [Marinoscillum sp.]|uniref:FtsX-like permease family protein n=1 Tax=Marinoscillum sp. TaxID=2024838 RepID=UPI003BAB1248